MLKKLVKYLKENHIKILIKIFKILFGFTLWLCGLEWLGNSISWCIRVFKSFRNMIKNISNSNKENNDKR